jgi:predicted nuclease with TOPRIM domain
MKTTLSLTIIAAVVAVFLSAAGCGKQVVSDNRVSRLTADENYRVKKQFDQLNKQITALTKELEQCKQRQAGLSADKQQNDLLVQENQQLKNSLNEMPANVQGLSEQLEECQKNLALPENKRVKEMADELAKTKKEAEESVNFVMTTVREESEKEAAALRGENETLKAEVQKLQDELKQLKK